MNLYFQFLVVLILALYTYGEKNSEKLLDLAGFSSSKSRNLELKGFGTGFAVNHEGYLISASHVTEGCDAVRVIFKNGESVNAKIIKEEPKLDLVLLKVDMPTPSFLSVTGRTSGLGDDVYTIGYPSPEILGINQKFTRGSISALSGLFDDAFRYQISIPIQPGNSGGPVVCEETGEVVGIVVSSLKGKDVVGFNPQNVNFALKSAFIKPIMDFLDVDSPAKSDAEISKNTIRKKVVEATCMVVTCKYRLLSSKEENNVINSNRNQPFQLLGGASMAVMQHTNFDDPGFTPSNLSVQVKGNVNVNVLGNYYLEYILNDDQSNVKILKRRVNVVKNQFWTINVTQPPASTSLSFGFFSNKKTIEVYANDNFVGEMSHLELNKDFKIIGKYSPEPVTVKMFRRDNFGKKLFYNQKNMVVMGDKWDCTLGSNIKDFPM